MKVRYCQTPLQKIFPCGVGYGSWKKGSNTKEGWIISACNDDPMEKYCHNIIDTDDLRCPVCGGKITMEIISEQVDRFSEAWKNLAKK